jgi:ketopantoate reductase
MRPRRRRPRILLVGAGAVGQVYGRHFQLGGAEVAFLVRPRHADRTRAGFRLYPLRRGGPHAPVRFAGFDVLTTVTEVQARRWDAVVLCVPSPALREGSWLEDVIAATGTATVVTLQPGLTDFDHVVARAGAERVVAGMIGLCAYAAPLPGETLPEPGTAYWIPPLGQCPFSGASERTRVLVRLLRRGGFPAAVHADVPRALAFGAALLEPHMVALECAGWSLARLRGDRALLDTARRASREAAEVAAVWRNAPVPWHIGRIPMGLALRLAPWLAPLDLEGFFRAHYTKVGAQTRRLLATYQDLAGQHGRATPALDALGARLQAGAGAEALA